MQLTKWTHSCVTFEKDGAGKLVVDPGGFSETGPALAGAAAVLVTHEHPDHLDEDAVRTALAGNDTLTLHAPAAVTSRFAEFGERVVAVSGGQALDVAGWSLRTFGDQHALIHARVPLVANVGFLVDDAVFHPGDCLTVPPVPVSTLLLPVSAPWARSGEVLDYAIAVRAPRTVGIHEQVYSEAGRGIVSGLLTPALESFGCTYELPAPGSDLDLDG